MKDLILDSGYGEWIKCPFSSNSHDQCIYIHWDCWEEKTDEEWFKHDFRNHVGISLNFMDFIYYALLHEELHLVLFILGEEDYRVKGKENIFHNELMTRVLIGTVKGSISMYKQRTLNRWV